MTNNKCNMIDYGYRLKLVGARGEQLYFNATVWEDAKPERVTYNRMSYRKEEIQGIKIHVVKYVSGVVRIKRRICRCGQHMIVDDERRVHWDSEGKAYVGYKSQRCREYDIPLNKLFDDLDDE